MSAVCDPVTAGRRGLTEREVEAFLARARQLGHDPARLLAGEVTQTRTPVPDLEQLRELSCVSPAERRARQAVFFHPAIAIRSRLGQGVHDRCEAYVFAEGTAAGADRTRLARHLPFAARQLSVLYRRVAADEVWDLTVAPGELGLDDRDDLLNVINVGELVIEPGGRVIVQGNLLMLGCQHLRVPAPGRRAADYQLGVLPTPHPVDARTGPRHGRAGAPGAAGPPGRNGTRPAGVPTLIGLALSEPPGEAMNGTDGIGGTRGGHGGAGRTGGAAKTAEITIGRLTGSLTLVAAGGDGGCGGNGGPGGDGGYGGDAVPGFRSLAGPVDPGRPGRGGPGGGGGDGGRGGHGGISSNVFVTLPEPMTSQLTVVTYPAAGGTGGTGGAGGRPGQGGRGGRGGNDADGANEADGADGLAGVPGKTGRDGVRRPPPAVFVNGKPVKERTVSP
jgi:hypothetical protein